MPWVAVAWINDSITAGALLPLQDYAGISAYFARSE